MLRDGQVHDIDPDFQKLVLTNFETLFRANVDGVFEKIFLMRRLHFENVNKLCLNTNHFH